MSEPRREHPPAAPKPEPQRIPILRRCLVGPDETQVSLDVFCPSQEATVPAERCAECGFIKAFPRHAMRPNECIECTPPGMAERDAARRSKRADMTEIAARVPLGEIVGRQVVCVRPETSIETLMRVMLDEDIDAVPVVDAEWRLVGIISRSDVLRARYADDDREESLDRPARGEVGPGFHVQDRVGETVAARMEPAAHTLPENARLAHAMSLMAVEGVTHVPVLTGDGGLVGVVTALDCLRWISRQMGYEVPPDRAVTAPG